MEYRERIKANFPVTAVSSNSTDGSVASLLSTDSVRFIILIDRLSNRICFIFTLVMLLKDSESSLGRLSDPITTVINTKSQFQRRGPTNLRHSPPVAGLSTNCWRHCITSAV